MDYSFDFSKLLTTHQKKHKNKPPQFESVAGGVTKRLQKNLKTRKSSRQSSFDVHRTIPKCYSPVPAPIQLKSEYRKQKLEKWKQEKEKKKKEAAMQKKKPFLTGIPSVPLKYEPPPPLKVLPSSSGRVTRSQSAKRAVKNEVKHATQPSFAPENASFKPPFMKNKIELPKLTSVKTRSNLKTNITLFSNQSENRNRFRLPKLAEEMIKPGKSGIQKTHKSQKTETTVQKIEKTKVSKPHTNAKAMPLLFSSLSSVKENSVDTTSMRKSPTQGSRVTSNKTPRKSVKKAASHLKQVPKSESSFEERLRSPKSSSDEPSTPELTVKISPFVTLSRGKDNARREMKKKMALGLLDEDVSNTDDVDHFRRQLSSEIKRMSEMCETWDRVSEQTVLPESVQEAVLMCVGQARLLMSQKLQQFASLVERCARPEPGAALVTPADLHGFWDMVFMQIENVDVRFKKLEELRSCGWVEQQQEETKKAVAKPKAKAIIKPKGGPSQLREMIAAARKAKKDQEHSQMSLVPAPLAISDSESKTFEAGFFYVRSPIKSPTADHTPIKNNSLLKTVLSNEARKASASKSAASLAMLRASVLSKNVECDTISGLQSPINIYATPGRSILKQANVQSANKALKVVLFDQEGDRDVSKPERGADKVSNMTTDSRIVNIQKTEEKENSKRKSKIKRQDAIHISPEDRSPVMTRSRRKSMTAAEALTPRRSKVLQEAENNVADNVITPRRSSRRHKSGVQVRAQHQDPVGRRMLSLSTQWDHRASFRTPTFIIYI